MYILGISSYYHDSAAALIKDGMIVCAAEEERFSRIKHDSSFPSQAIKFCMEFSSISIEEIDEIVFYDKPLLKFERILETFITFAPFGFKSFKKIAREWGGWKIQLEAKIKKEIQSSFEHIYKRDIHFSSHHLSHAASAFYPSPYEKAAIICIDGVGEWATLSVWKGENNSISPLWQINFPHSIGLLYSSFTQYLGFEVNDGEYKVMGLAPYGTDRFVELIKNELIDIQEDGTFKLSMKYFEFCTDLKMIGTKFERLFQMPTRIPESELLQFHMDIAKSIQVILEEVVLKICHTVRKETGLDNLCLSGGVALNCVANGKVKAANIFQQIWVQPAATDAGGAIGAALALNFIKFKNERIPSQTDQMNGAFLGPEFSNIAIEALLNEMKIEFKFLNDEELLKKTASLLDNQQVIGWFQGRMEFGPRALGNRSILADSRDTKMQSRLNQKIKFRESFRPFAPAILDEDTHLFYEDSCSDPYMLFTRHLKNEKRINIDGEMKLPLNDRLKGQRSIIGAVTHLDYSSRVQSVNSKTHGLFYRLISEFKKISGIGIVINTSFNIRGEPIVCTPKDAIETFFKSGLDYLVLGNFIINKMDNSQMGISNEMMTKSKEEIRDRHIVIPANSSERRSKTLKLAVFTFIIFGVLLPLIRGNFLNVKAMIVIFVFWLLSYYEPFFKIFYLGWMLFGRVSHFIKLNILLLVVYFGPFTILSAIYRLFNLDPLKLKKNSPFRANVPESKLDLFKSY